MDELQSSTPEGQDGTVKHGDDSQESDSFGNVAPPKTESPSSPPKHCHPYDCLAAPSPWWRRLSVWQFLFEILIFIVTVRIAWIYSDQLSEMITANDVSMGSFRRARIDANGQLKESAKQTLATNRQWGEMQTQTRIQRNTGINSERAWVGLDGKITLDGFAVKSDRVAIKGHFRIKNFGHGPAFKVTEAGLFTQHTALEEDKRSADFWCDSSVAFATGTVPVGRGTKQPGPFGYTLFPDQGKDYPIEVEGPVATLDFLQYVGCVAYIDQFKMVHWTRFCMMRYPRNPITLPTEIPELEFCSLYNDTDKPK
jgi:hypothetical protein